MQDPLIVEGLTRLRLASMRDEYIRQCEKGDAMEFLPWNERLLMMVDAETNRRQNNRLAKNLRDANLFDKMATLNSILWKPERRLIKENVMRLSGCSFIREGRDLLITGGTGTGKTFFSSAFGTEACSLGYTVRAYKMHRLLTSLSIGVNDGTYEQVLADLMKPHLLILEDFGMDPIEHGFCRNFLEVIDDRHRFKKSVLITSQFDVSDWHGRLQDKTAADAIMDRLSNGSYRLQLSGPSMRREDRKED